MTPLTRENVETFLSYPEGKGDVVSAYADLTVKDGFHDFFERNFRNETRAVVAATQDPEARKALDEILDEIRRAVLDVSEPRASGVAVFVSPSRGRRDVRPLDFPVENRLVVDEAPFILPLLERWYGEPSYLVALVDSGHAHVFEASHGTVEAVGDLGRAGAHNDTQTDKPRFTNKKRFAQTFHERLQGAAEDKFFQEVAEGLARQWSQGGFHGLILVGRATVLGAMRRLLPRDLAHAVIEDTNVPTSAGHDEIAAEVERVVGRWHAGTGAAVLAEFHQRWKENHLVASGPGEVLDSLQQGRASQVVCTSGGDGPGARCRTCGYRFGVPAETCRYCGGRCRPVNAVQEVVIMAWRQRLPVHFFRRGEDPEPLRKSGGAAALLRAEANWAPDKATARASQGA